MKWKKIKYPYYFSADLPDNGKGLFNNFIDFFGFDRMTGPLFDSVRDFGRFLQGNKSYNNVKVPGKEYRSWDKMPDCDHGRVFKIQGTKKIVYVNQPYQFNKKDLEQWCNERNLIYVICDKKYSFYYPGNTEMILIMSNETYIDFLEIPGFPAKWEE